MSSSRKCLTYEHEDNYLACSVDNNTDRKVHGIIFAEQTVVAILHRGEQLHRFDRVARVSTLLYMADNLARKQ